MEYSAVLLLLVGVVRLSENYEMAKLRNAHNLLTSSTLAWTPYRIGNDLPSNLVPIGKGGPAWCRAREHAVWVPGAVVDGRCKVPFLGSVTVSENYQLLVSLNGSARLVHVPWDSLVALPANTVATPDMLLALKSDAEGSAMLPGFVDPQERRAHFLRGTDAVKETGGLVVTEAEPVRYRLTDVRLGNKTDSRVHEEILQEFNLENRENHSSEVSRVVAFLSPHIVYFGMMKGTIVGLPASVSGPDIFPVDITWGITNDFNKNVTHTVSYELPAMSSVKIQLIAAIRNLEGAYSGRLTSVYEDGVQLERTIGGIHTERRLAELRAVFGQTISLKDGFPIEELTPQTLVLLHSTTTTPAPLSASNKEGFSGVTSVYKDFHRCSVLWMMYVLVMASLF